MSWHCQAPLFKLTMTLCKCVTCSSFRILALGYLLIYVSYSLRLSNLFGSNKLTVTLTPKLWYM